MSLNYKIIGKRIKEIRSKQKLTQLELADIIEKSYSYISYIETGKKQLSLETLIDIANALRVTADELLSSIVNLTKTIIYSMPLVIPPTIDDQIEIAHYLDNKCGAIDSLIAEKETLIMELKNYKQSLIFQTVTGKRRVV